MSLNVLMASQLGEAQKEPEWLIEGLWLDGGVGIIGGEPKSYKTFAALSLAIATASGKACFGHYNVKRKGPVLLYAAEDSLSMVRERIAGISSSLDISLDTLELHIIAEPRLLIDTDADRQRLQEAITRIEPVLLVLDPFVRLHSIDENSSNEVSQVLSWLRSLQRQHCMNVAMVHHARKRGGKERPGQNLRGSSELHAWGDSNLYLRRIAEEDNLVQLSIEHRAARSDDNIRIRLQETSEGPYLHYEGGGHVPDKPLTAEERLFTAMCEAGGPLSGEDLRQRCGIRSATFWKTLRELQADGRVSKSKDQLYYAESSS